MIIYFIDSPFYTLIPNAHFIPLSPPFHFSNHKIDFEGSESVSVVKKPFVMNQDESSAGGRSIFHSNRDHFTLAFHTAPLTYTHTQTHTHTHTIYAFNSKMKELMGLLINYIAKQVGLSLQFGSPLASHCSPSHLCSH